MYRLWIILRTEIKAWRADPFTAMGGLIPPLFILLAFNLMFGSRPTFKIAFINHDAGTTGEILHQALQETLSPFGFPYYDLIPLSEAEAWQSFKANRLDGVWVIPADFSQRVTEATNPHIEMHFSNYIDDFAKNHRIYQAEVLWRFYELIGQPEPPLAISEEYPLPEMVNWLPIIGVGIALMSFILGGMMNIMMLTYKEQLSKVTLEFGLAPRSLGWVLFPKIFLALGMSLLTGTIFLGILYLLTGVWPAGYLAAVWVLAGLVSLFWISIMLLFGLRARHFMGAAIGTILTGMTVFFIGGGLAMVRNNAANVPWFSWFFPNTHAVDPMRDLILFHSWPVEWNVTIIKLSGFALLSIIFGVYLAAKQLRKIG